MLVTNTTVQNRSKQLRLSSEHILPVHSIKQRKSTAFLQSLLNLDAPKEQILFSIGRHLLKDNRNPAVKNFLAGYDYKPIVIENVPENEVDLLGAAYQFLNSKKENLEKGSFYTSSEIADDFVGDLDFSSGQVIFDRPAGLVHFYFVQTHHQNRFSGLITTQ